VNEITRAIVSHRGYRYRRSKIASRLYAMRSNTRERSRHNVHRHYDLGNDFYRLWLDETMTYSSALFESGQESLESAQTAKYASLIDQMGARPGDHVLEIGCGWGGFAEFAARERGLRVTGLTISREDKAHQLELLTTELRDLPVRLRIIE